MGVFELTTNKRSDELTHLVSTEPTQSGHTFRCSCGFNASSLVFGSREAARLGHAHIAYPDATIAELIVGPNFKSPDEIGINISVSQRPFDAADVRRMLRECDQQMLDAVRNKAQ